MRGTYRAASLALVLGLSSLVAAAPQQPPVSDISIPQPPIERIPKPEPRTDAVVRLASDQLYVIDAKIECVVRAHPPGLVKISKKKGPRDISARFVDGSGGIEDRTYAGPFIYFVQTAGSKSGRVALDIIPLGLKSEAQIVSTEIDVVPDLSPAPDPKPKPDPEPKPKPITGVAWIVVIEETDQRNEQTARVLNDTLYWKGLESRGIKYRFYDKDSPDLKGKNFDSYQTIDPQGQSIRRKYADELGLPYLLFLDATAYKIKAVPLPKKTSDIDKILNGEAP